MFEENTIRVAKLFLQVRESFLSKIKSIPERKIEEPVTEYTSNSAPKSMGDLARILQAVQAATSGL